MPRPTPKPNLGREKLDAFRRMTGEMGGGLPPIAQVMTNATGAVKPVAAPAPAPAAPRPAAPRTRGGGTYDANRFAALVSGVESGGNYNAVNRHSGARGKYQIMPSNWASWSRAAGLPANSDWSPANQERVALHKFNEYLSAFGPEGAAVAWYAGPAAAQAYVRNPGDSRWDRPQAGYPSIRSYANKVTSGY